MTEIIEPELMDNEVECIQLTADYRITADARNIILQERYEKKLGKGRNAEGSGIFDYKDIAYYGSLDSLGKSLIHREVIQSLREVDKLEDIIAHIDKIKDDVQKHITEFITIEQGEIKKNAKKVKGVTISE